MRPSTRNFFWGVGVAALAFALMLVRTFARLSRSGGDNQQGMIVELAVFGVIFLLGVGFAWIRLANDRKERAKRKPPLNM